MTYPTLQTLLEAEADTPRTRSTPIDIDAAQLWLFTNAPQQYDALLTGTGGTLYRGNASAPSTSCLLADPTTSVRRSSGNSDLYRAILDAANPDWPERGRSLIVTTDIHYAKAFGTVFHVIPPDDAVVAYVGVSDIWRTGAQLVSEIPVSIRFMVARSPRLSDHKTSLQWKTFTDTTTKMQNNQFTSLDQWRAAFVELHQALHQMLDLLGPSDAAKVRERLEHWQMMHYSQHKFLDQARGLLIDWFEHPQPTYDIVGQLVRVMKYPNLGNFSKATGAAPPQLLGSEAWVASECLLVPLKMMDELLSPPEDL